MRAGHPPWVARSVIARTARRCCRVGSPHAAWTVYVCLIGASPTHFVQVVSNIERVGRCIAGAHRGTVGKMRDHEVIRVRVVVWKIIVNAVRTASPRLRIYDRVGREIVCEVIVVGRRLYPLVVVVILAVISSHEDVVGRCAGQ